MTKIAMRSATEQERASAGAPVTLLHSPSTGQNGAPSQLAPLETGDTIESIRQEIADAQRDAETFYQREPDEIIRLVSGHSARLSTLRTMVGRMDGHPLWRRAKAELEEVIADLRNQFDYASRIIASRELDWKIETGGRQT